jgi:SAM-dependent methyltransferase
MSVPADPDRLASERAFHNARYGREGPDPRAHLDEAYLAVARVNILQERAVHRLGAGRDVLEYGCADGTLSLAQLRTPGFARSFTGIDISDAAIARATARAASLGTANARYLAQDAAATSLPAASFDVIYGRGILHHLDLSRGVAEVRRLLRPGGTALFTEPLGHNPLLNWYRRRTPDLRTPDEQPLRMSDIVAARAHFAAVEATFAGLTTVAAIPFLRTRLGRPLLAALDRVDAALLTLRPIQPQAWYVLLTMRA